MHLALITEAMWSLELIILQDIIILGMAGLTSSIKCRMQIKKELRYWMIFMSKRWMKKMIMLIMRLMSLKRVSPLKMYNQGQISKNHLLSWKNHKKPSVKKNKKITLKKIVIKCLLQILKFKRKTKHNTKEKNKKKHLKKKQRTNYGIAYCLK